MKKLLRIYLPLFSLMVCLTACPYKELYKSTSNPIKDASFEISPGTFFYNSFKRFSTCDAMFTIKNVSRSNQKISFLSSYLQNATNKVSPDSIYDFGVGYSPSHVFDFSPGSSLALGIHFKDSTKNFGDTFFVKLSFPSSQEFRYVYRRND